MKRLTDPSILSNFPALRVCLMLLFSILTPSLAYTADRPIKVPGVKITCETASDCLRILRTESEDAELRGNAIAILGSLKEIRAVPDLIGIVESHPYGDSVYHYHDTPNTMLVVTAMRALGTIRDQRALPILIEFVQKEPYIQYRVLAAEMIKLIGVDREDIPMLLNLLNDPHTSIRYVIFEAIHFADDPISKRFTKRFINYIPRADMIEDTITAKPNRVSLGVPIYPKAHYIYYASASEKWIMRESPQALSGTQWIHTFFTKDPLNTVIRHYKKVLRRNPLTRRQIETRFSFIGTEDDESTFIGKGFGYIVNRSDHPDLRTPSVVISIYEDKVLEGTAITIFAPRR